MVTMNMSDQMAGSTPNQVVAWVTSAPRHQSSAQTAVAIAARLAARAANSTKTSLSGESWAISPAGDGSALGRAR